MAGLTTLCGLLFVAALCAGPVFLNPALLPGLFATPGDDPLSIILIEIRLPRAILALAIGGSLGMAGAALQGLLQNPLAEPGIIGVSGCAALAAVIVFYSGLAGLNAWLLPFSGIGGAMLAVMALHLLAGRTAGSLTIILAGVAINSVAAALTSLVLNLAPNPFAAYDIFFWLMGSLANRSFDHVWLMLPLAACGWITLLSARRGLDALTLGDDAASSLGIDLVGLRRRVILGAALAVGSAVAVSGVIGFVGLIVPHILRPWFGYRPGALLPAAFLGGGALTLAADLGTRYELTHGDLKLGVVTALVGAPFFIHLVLKLRSER